MVFKDDTITQSLGVMVFKDDTITSTQSLGVYTYCNKVQICIYSRIRVVGAVGSTPTTHAQLASPHPPPPHPPPHTDLPLIVLVIV
jgi:hypothetical protein